MKGSRPPFKQALTMMVILSALSLGFLFWAERLSHNNIAENDARHEQALWGEVLGFSPNDPSLGKIEQQCLDFKDSATGFCFYKVMAEGSTLAILVPVTAPKGYNGPIQLLVGIHRAGFITGVRVIHHQETPGLGDLIEANKSSWIQSFKGASLEKPNPTAWSTRREGGAFDAFTGATITPRAIIETLKKTLEQVNLHHAEIFNP